MTFIVGGETFELPGPFLAIHSPEWARRFAEDSELKSAELPGEAASFRAFVQFMRGESGDAGEVTAHNVLDLLHWGQQLGVDYVSSQCESFLLTSKIAPAGLEHANLIEAAARYDMPLVYARATESIAQGTHHIEVPESNSGIPVNAAFLSRDIREDVLKAHVSMGLMRSDAEMRRRHRFADHTALPETEQRARLLWKSRRRFVPPPEHPPDHDWRALQTVWPHHSLRGEDWTAVPYETQPTMPLRNPGAIGGALQTKGTLSRFRG